MHFLEDDEENLWIGSNRGILRAKIEDLLECAGGATSSVEYQAYGIADGMRSMESMGGMQPGCCKARDGRMWFPTTHGVVMVDPKNLKINRLPPPVHIETVLVDGREIPVTAGPGSSIPIELSPGATRLEFHHAALSFSAPKRNRFQYRLEGLDESWSESTPQLVAYYMNIPPGSYRYRVIACNNDNVWNEAGASFDFYLKSHFYQTVWFYALCGIALIMAAFAVYRLRVRNLKINEKKLVALVAARTSELNEKNEELSRINQALFEANELKTNLLHLAAHDLKNPLNGIFGFSEEIRDSIDDRESVLEMINWISMSAEQMLNVITDLLKSGTIEMGELELKMELVDLSELILAVVQANRPQAERKYQTIECKIGDDCMVMGDRNRLRDAFDNLISNAVKYSEYHKKILVTLERFDAKVLFKATDEGPGISGEEMDKLFLKCQRLSPRPTGGESSTGMGLSITKDLIEHHGGRIWAESELGKGSTFFVELAVPDSLK